MSEETKNADVAGPWGMVGAIIGSSILGWIFIISLSIGIFDYHKTMTTSTGFPVTQILMDNFGYQWTIVFMCSLLLACWFCGLATVISNSRMIYAFSRDGAMVIANLVIFSDYLMNETFFFSHGAIFGNESTHD